MSSNTGHGKNQETVKACWPATVVWQVKMCLSERPFSRLFLCQLTDLPLLAKSIWRVQLFSSSQMQRYLHLYLKAGKQKTLFQVSKRSCWSANIFNNNDNQPQKEELFFIAQCVTLFEITTGGATNPDPLASERPHQSPQSLFWRQARLSLSL